MAAISPRLAVSAKLHNTQKRNPYNSETEPPDGRISPIDPARAIHVLETSGQCCGVSDSSASTYFRMAKAIATMVNPDSRGWRWPSLLFDVVPADISMKRKKFVRVYSWNKLGA